MRILGHCGDAPLRERIGVIGVLIFLLGMVAVGVDMIFHPRRHMNGYLRSGGEMLREWNELQIRILGLVIVCGGSWVVYYFCSEIWRSCFA